MEWVNKISASICGFIVLGTAVLAVFESIMRQAFNSPTIWTLNLSTGIFIWAAFLGSPWAFQELGHVSIDMIRNIIDKRAKGEKRLPRRIISIIGYLSSFTVVSMMLYGGVMLCQRALRFSALAPYAFRFPLIISYSAIVVGSVLMLVTLIFIILDLLAGGDKYM